MSCCETWSHFLVKRCHHNNMSRRLEEKGLGVVFLLSLCFCDSELDVWRSKTCKQFNPLNFKTLPSSNIVLIHSYFPSLLWLFTFLLFFYTFLFTLPPTHPLSPVNNDNMHTLFITRYCTCSVALHYINYSHWKSDHQPPSESITTQFPQRPGPVNNHRCR